MLERMDEAPETPLTCPRCGSPLPPAARFCPRCGQPLAFPTTEERRVVTIMFADLVGSTALAAAIDPERFREVLGAFYRLASTELESLRGRAEKFIGDAVMAVFGLPQTHEDDALRAVRAALLIRDGTSRLGEELGLPHPLRVHVGINSGPVATGSGPSDQLLVSGAPVNLAARLQEAARVGEILVGETTWLLTRNSVEFGPPRTVPAAGFSEEVRAWPVIALSTRSTRRTIPLVDRRRELALLFDTFERAREASRPHLFTLLGEPGIGKTRLVDEFVAGLPDGAKVLSGRASPFDEDATFAPLAEMIRRELEVEPGAPVSEVQKKLNDIVSGCCDPTEIEQTVARLGLALGLDRETATAEPQESGREDSWALALGRLQAKLGGEGSGGRMARTAEIRAGVIALLTGLTRTGPVVIVFDDLHLAQPALLELIEGVIAGARRLPLLVACVARDDLLEHRPGWGGGLSDSATLRLEPLRLAEAKDLARAAGESLDDATAERIAIQTGGNPFFIIETTGMLLQKHPEHRTGVAHSHVLPPTVQAVVASRIDHLPEDARDLVRKASVFARSTFDLSQLALITEPKGEILRTLEDEEVLVHDPDRSGVWRFRHEMLREVAYESLPKRERLRLHLQVADGLDANEPGQWPQAVAYHLEQAALASLDLDPPNRTLPNRAVKALVRAGDLARRRIESSAAIDLYERALVLAGPEDTWGPREARILTYIGEARYWLGEYKTAVASLSKALEVGKDDVWTRAHACRFLGDLALNFEGDVDRATELFNQAQEAARASGDPWILARTLLMAGWAPYWRNDLATARTMFEEALSIVRSNKEGDLWAEARALISLTSVISPVGDETECLTLAEEALELGRKMGDAFTTAVAQETVGNSLRRMGRFDEAVPHLEGAVRTFRELGARWELASALGDRGLVRRLQRDLDAAFPDIQESLELCKKIGERSLVAWTASEMIRLLLAKGDRAGAERVLDDPAVWPDQAEPGSREYLLFAEAAVALADGDWARARLRAVDLLDIAHTIGWANLVAARVWWVGRIFGPEAAGGEDAVEQARKTLEANHWVQGLLEPEFVLESIAAEPAR
jgi:class 3 adenylate cyclase/tetratricopeptide (TPR) repeat protein